MGCSLFYSLLKSIYVLDFTSAGFILVVLWYVLLYLLTISAKLLIYTIFDTEVIYLLILFFRLLINFSPTADFHSLCFEYIFISLSYNHDLIDILRNQLPLSTHILFGLRLNSSNIFWEALVILIPFLSFKGAAHACFLKNQ